MRRPRRPTFSILLPTHNRSDVLPYAIRSVQAQSRSDFELLVVGDGCTDDTAEVVASFDDRRIRWFDLPKAPNFGYANRNIALREARGELIAFAAHDDLLFPDHLERLAPYFDDPRIDLAYSRPLWGTPDGTLVPSAFNLHIHDVMGEFVSMMRNEIPASCVVHRRSCFDRVGYWDADLAKGGDWDMWVRILNIGNRDNFAFHPQPTTIHFRANWRTAGPGFVKQGQERIRSAPDGLSIDVAGVTEQSAIWEAIDADGGGWPDRVRTAVVRELDSRVRDADRFERRLQ